MKIAFAGKFKRLYDEEYIAQSFEMLGHEVVRISEGHTADEMIEILQESKPDIFLCTKFQIPQADKVLAFLKEVNIPSVSWTFDLYWDYEREHRIKTTPGFKCEYVFTSDGGHQGRWEAVGINHQCVRQGIFTEQCVREPYNDPKGVIFVGSHNPQYPERQKMMSFLDHKYDFQWYGKFDTNYVRNEELNELYAKSKIVVGDSVYSPYYWSNRVVETLGRGGFLIHQDVEGLKREYPHLVTYRRGDLGDLQQKINYYLTHEDERREIVEKNFAWVRARYTADKKCAELLAKL